MHSVNFISDVNLENLSWKLVLNFYNIRLFLICSFPTHYAIRNRVISFAIQKLKYLYYKIMKTRIIVIRPSRINCKRTKNKCSILQPMSTELIYTIFIKFWFAHLLKDIKTYTKETFISSLILFPASYWILNKWLNNFKIWIFCKILFFLEYFVSH